MKNHGYDKKSVKKRFLFSKFFADMYYFLALHIYLILTILGTALSIAAILFVAEWLFPDAVHFFNVNLTDKAFTELVKDHKYHEAIALMEVKEDLIETSDDPIRFRTELADCYVHTGDYPKALEQYRLQRELIAREMKNNPPEDMTEAEKRKLMDMADAFFLKEEFRIYMKMGDLSSIREHSKILRQKQSSIDWDMILDFLPEEEREKLNEKLDGHRLEDGFRLELIQGKYMEDPQTGIMEMEKYTIDVANSTKFNQVYKLHLFNELLRMLMEQGDVIAARHYLELALKIVYSLEYNSIIFPELGELSEYCYQLNDVADGKKLLKKYLVYIVDTYDESDIDYAVAHAMEFKYLQADGDWDELTERIEESGRSLREQITKNFTGMTAAQRVYFIGQFMPLFTYVNTVVEQHPSEALAKVAFDNNMFLRGLLLRSETSVRNTIMAMNRPELTEKYDRFVTLSCDLASRQYVSGPGNYLRKRQLEKEIAQLETDIASQSMEFRRENAKENFTAGKLRKVLDSNEVAVQIVEGGRTYYALALGRNGKVDYIPLGDKAEVNALMSDRAGIYTDCNLTRTLMSKLLSVINDKEVYLTPSGIFNKVALAAIPIEANGKTVGDVADIHLVGSSMDIAAVKERDAALDFANRNAVLWGGVDYGMAGDTMQLADAMTGGVLLRGEELRFLPGSLQEVNDIAALLRGNGNNVTVISGRGATEKSLAARSRRNDYILHISTHGFFHDKGAFANPMQNAGLLFAGSQKYWMNDSIATTLTEADGILRADEIAGLDLSGCRLVVLSACRTGLGESNAEGVYGLQRAFKLAGVQSILMSLWSVDDAATRELMKVFYAELLAGKVPDAALTAAKNRMRREGKSPAQWAAFVLLN